MNVDLPAPFGPRIAVCSPSGILIVRPSSTRAPPRMTVASASSRKWVLDSWAMPPAVSVLVADSSRMTAVGGSIQLPGRVLRFVSNNLPATLDGLRTSRAGLLAIDGVFAATPEGKAFIDRVQKLALPGLDIRLVARIGGVWATTPLDGVEPAAAPPPAAHAPLVVHPRAAAPALAGPPAAGGAPPPLVKPAADAPAIDVKASGLNTRRTPRFVVLDPIEATVDTSGKAGLIDVSVMGAQLLSAPPLRPNQTLKVALPDTDAPVRVI